MSVTVPAPEQVVGLQLTDELQAAGYTDVRVILYPAIEARAAGEGQPAIPARAATLVIDGRTASGAELGDASRGKIEGLVRAHRPLPAPAAPVDLESELIAALEALPANPTPAALRDALVAAARRRVSSRPRSSVTGPPGEKP